MEALREKAKELLRSGQVECVIGYERATDGVTARPLFAYTPEEAERFIFDQTCVHNLTRYLVERQGKPTAVVVKPCDSRAIHLLVREKQIARDKVFALGVTCPGMVEVEWGKVGKGFQGRCQGCSLETPVVYDYLIVLPGERRLSSLPLSEEHLAQVRRLERMSPQEREAFWQKHFERCIRCYACRQICPGCYCPLCFVDQVDPQWVGIKIAPPQNWMWHTIRAFHLAGRCVECGECQRVCPVRIPLMLLNDKLTSEVEGQFSFKVGMDLDTPPPFATFQKEELEGK